MSVHTDRKEHDEQAREGTHLLEAHCPFCFFDVFDPESRAEVFYDRLDNLEYERNRYREW